ncbi:MAG: SHOCT domain-containing protein [Microcella sp.]|uniref:SHOCT domain-containing protein n=1 Tax=Microcella sp. TaxID=1913979 RepID=UPI0024C5A9C9|nr:SHOCT domain-containing protein [Microcella sp.]UYN83496.1 MAG: SHOCT domain-containing protein [Microcella sp.]
MRLLRTATHAAVASSVHGKVQRRQHSKWAQQAAAAPAAAPAAAAPAPEPAAASDMSATLEQLKQLGELRDAGILTPEEFEAKKAVILG